jgi:hypothetical protein
VTFSLIVDKEDLLDQPVMLDAGQELPIHLQDFDVSGRHRPVSSNIPFNILDDKYERAGCRMRSWQAA